MDYQSLLGVLAVILAAYSAYNQRKQTQMMVIQASTAKALKGVKNSAPWWISFHFLALVVVAALAWVPFLIGALQETPARVATWGQSPTIPNASQIIVDGTSLSKYKSRYRMIAICFHWFGKQDIQDMDPLQKSAVMDIQDGAQLMPIFYDDTFTKEMQSGQHGTIYALLIIPKEHAQEGFSTLRQAYSLGAKTVWNAGGPP